MKKILLLAALLFSWQVQAATSVSANAKDGAQNTLILANDDVTVTVFGQWTSVRFRGSTIGSTTQVASEMSFGGGIWIPSPFPMNVSNGSSSDMRSAFTISASVVETWEVILPANVSHFRVRNATGGSGQLVSIFGWQPYIPGQTINTILYDVTSGVNAALDTTQTSGQGWSSLFVAMGGTGGTPSFQIDTVVESGSTFGAVIGAPFAAFGSTVVTNPPKYFKVTSAAIAAQTTRLRIEGRR